MFMVWKIPVTRYFVIAEKPVPLHREKDKTKDKGIKTDEKDRKKTQQV